MLDEEIFSANRKRIKKMHIKYLSGICSLALSFSISGVLPADQSSTQNESKDGSGSRQDTVDNIRRLGSVQLTGTTVTGEVSVGGSVKAVDCDVGQIRAGGSANLTSTRCHDTIAVGGSIKAIQSEASIIEAGASVTLNDSRCLERVNAGGSIDANRCPQLGTINAGGTVELHECPNVNSVKAGGQVTLHQTTVHHDVYAGCDATVDHAQVLGTLICTSSKVVIEGSKIDTLRIRNPSSSLTNFVFSEGSQTLELIDSTVKNVIFEGGKGQVVLSKGSAITGTITGGSIQNTTKE